MSHFTFSRRVWDVTTCSLVDTDVSVVCSASIMFALVMVEAISSETSGSFYQTARLNKSDFCLRFDERAYLK